MQQLGIFVHQMRLRVVAIIVSRYATIKTVGAFPVALPSLARSLVPNICTYSIEY